MPTKEVVDEHVKVLGVENVAGTGIWVFGGALLVNEIKGLPAMPKDVCSVRERLQKLQQETVEPLRYLLRVNLHQASRCFTIKLFSSMFQWRPTHRG